MPADRRATAPVVSVVTVTFNDAPGLERTIASLSEQTHPGIEHIIVDGGSTDRTRQVIADHRPAHPLQVVSEPDDGIFDAINKGIRMATGDLVVCMNAGDRFSDPTDLAFVADDWQAAGWSWGYGCMRYVDEQGEAFAGDIQAPFNKRKLELGVAFVPHQAMYVDLRFQRRLGEYDPRFGIAADQEMAVRAAQLEAPRVWIRFMTDFLAGGAHAQISRWRRERLYHEMRTGHGRQVLRSRAADLAATAAISAIRSGRDVIAQAMNPDGRQRI